MHRNSGAHPSWGARVAGGRAFPQGSQWGPGETAPIQHWGLDSARAVAAFTLAAPAHGRSWKELPPPGSTALDTVPRHSASRPSAGIPWLPGGFRRAAYPVVCSLIRKPLLQFSICPYFNEKEPGLRCPRRS